jgi:hypothetical protein
MTGMVCGESKESGHGDEVDDCLESVKKGADLLRTYE